MNELTSTSNDLRNFALLEGLVDWVSLALLVDTMRELEPDADEDTVRKVVLSVIEDLATSGLVVIGSLDGKKGRFKAWTAVPSEGISRLASEWKALLHSVDHYTDGWIDNTAEGDEVARQLKKSSEAEDGRPN